MRAVWLFSCSVLLLLYAPGALAQIPTPASSAASRDANARPAAEPGEPAKDTLGRDTPRGTVLGFIGVARKGNDEVAPLYLNTTLRDREAAALARKLFVVLDTRLPPRLNELSDKPEGSVPNPLKPNQDVVGTISTRNGSLDLVVERVNRGALGPVWLFSRQTLEAIPDVYEEVDVVSIDRFLPNFLKRSVFGIRLFEWLILFVLGPLAYRLAGLLSRLVRPAVRAWRHRRGQTDPLPATLVPGSIRLLLLAIAIRWAIVAIELPLIERQFWAALAKLLAIGGVSWSLLMLNGAAERYLNRRVRGAGTGGMSAITRLVRRVGDALVLAASVLVTLHYFGFDPTAALAGLGIGGIAVALAAQKTLENVIGGLSIIFDRALSVGDVIRLGDTVGTVDLIGLRSTRIRTLDRTMLTVPNGQMATVNIETLSDRDKFWFHHTLCLPFDATSEQLERLTAAIRTYLTSHSNVDRLETIRVRFYRIGPFSFDIELFAYVLAVDWERFLEVQQEMLIHIMAIVESGGGAIALPAQTLRLADARSPAASALINPARGGRGTVASTLALLFSCALGLLHASATPAAAQSPSPIRVTIRPLLIQAPIFGASIDLPRLPSGPETPGGDDGSEVSGSTDVSLNSAYMAGVDVQANRWFAEFRGTWAAVSANRSTPRVDVATDARFYEARGGVRLFGGFAATVGVRRVVLDLDASLTLPRLDKTLEGKATPALWDPMVGVDWRGTFGDRVALGANVQGGGFGVGTDVDVSGEATVDWRVAGPFVLRAGYTAVHYKLTVADVSIGSFQRTLISRQTLHGPVIGVGLVF